MPEKEKYHVLLADDSEDDRWLLRRALRNYPHLAVVGEVTDGDGVIDWLMGHPPFHDREKYTFPDILLLDLKMPRKTGYQVLEWLSAQSYKNLVVVVLSGSFLPEDIKLCFSLGANSYYKKSSVTGDHQIMMTEIENLLRKR